MMDDIPLVCIGLPCAACSLSCPIPKIEKKPLETTSTIRLETHGIVAANERKNLGMIQFQYRGNFPSSYTHDPTKPLTAAVSCQDSAMLGLLASGVVVGKVYELGQPEAPFYDLPPRPAGRSPDFDGWVVCKKFSQMQDLEEKIREDLVVAQDLVLGDDKIDGVQVRGWVLTDMGYINQGSECCGTTYGTGKKEPRHINNKAKFSEMLKHSREGQIGDFGMAWMMRFRLPDQEFQIVGGGEALVDGDPLDTKFNPPRAGFTKNLLEEVSCNCMCKRVWKFPCIFGGPEEPLCKIPLYAQKYTGEGAIQVSQKSAHEPVQVVMNTRPKAWS
jgi:hypothetical protein